MSLPTPPAIFTLAQLKASGYQYRSIKDEMRENLIQKLSKGEHPFPGVLGYEDSVIPEIEQAVLSKHHLNLLGLRGQAKTRIARKMTDLLDEYIPVVEGSELNDDPLKPISRYALDLIAQHGEDTPISWMHRSERYTEKLATPDVTVADLIGDSDPIKAANLKLSYGDERVIHFGLIPRSNRCIFVINELPDLQARIQVALFNILQESDIQIRGYRLRIPLDVHFVFTANPEDYTNRGSIVTPLKDRIGSQILTHYPKSIEISRSISKQEARLSEAQRNRIRIPELAEYLIEQVAIEARHSEFVDAKSGVSARLTISALENLMSTAERRMVLCGEAQTVVRMGDLAGILPAIHGKIELVYEGEQEGASEVALGLIHKAIRTLFVQYFPDPSRLKKKKQVSPYQTTLNWFAENEPVDLMRNLNARTYEAVLAQIPGLDELLEKYVPQVKGEEVLFWKEFLLHGLAEYSQLGKALLESGGTRFRDLFGSMFNLTENPEEQED